VEDVREGDVVRGQDPHGEPVELRIELPVLLGHPNEELEDHLLRRTLVSSQSSLTLPRSRNRRSGGSRSPPVSITVAT
jgi:hypothetical protein